MKILWKQRQGKNDGYGGLFSSFGMERCYLKYIEPLRDQAYVTRKRHHHTGYEIHLVERGYQLYEIGGTAVRIDAGQFLLLPPTVPHCVLKEDEDTAKYSLTFELREGYLSASLPASVGWVADTIPDEVFACLARLERERSAKQAYGEDMMALLVWECAVRLLRCVGLCDRSDRESEREGDARFLLATQYIKDNICRAPAVSEVASYCGISQKQLNRIFEAEEGVAVSEYIRRTRGRQIELLLAESELSLRQISDRMDFQNEYYFNAFFKRYSGMSPGAYRKSIQKEG